MNNYKPILLINIVSLVIAILVYYVFDAEFEIITAIMATGISISLGVSKLQIENDKIFKELFQEFNTIYDDRFNNVLNRIVKKNNKNKDYTLDKKETEIIIDYLNFSAEEYLWFTKNRISKEVWNSWEKGIVYYLNIPPINKIVLKEKAQKDSYYGLFDRIGKRIKNF